MSQDWNFETKAIHSGLNPDSKTGATNPPIYQSAAFHYENAEDIEQVFEGQKFGYIYSRISNPSVTAFETNFNTLENGLGALATSSGLSAIQNILTSIAAAGDHIVASSSLFGGTYDLLIQMEKTNNLKTTFVPATDVDAYENAIQDDTQLIFLEAIGNPKCDVPDIKAITTLAAKHNIPVVVDSTLTTPFLLQAKALGIAIVVHSTTKYIAPSGTTIGGILVDLGNYQWKNTKSSILKEQAKVCGNQAFLVQARTVRLNSGNIQSPFNAFLNSVGLDSLSLRIQKHSDNALALAQALEAHPAVAQVSYPGLQSSPAHQVANAQFTTGYGGLLTIRCKTQENCFKVLNALKMTKRLANIGDSKTLAIHPASTIYRKLTPEERAQAGAYDDLIRISVGIEHKDDIIQDFTQALDAI